MNTSKEFAWAAKQCFTLFLENTALENLGLVVPEVADLYKNWHDFSGAERGEALGYIIGKYGVDILLSRGTARAIHYGKSLKRANFKLTLSAMKKSPANKGVIKKRGRELRRQRKLLRKNANLTIQADKQGKHIVGHRNYVASDNKSIFEHKKPQKLVKKHAGTGMKEGPIQAGKPGYREVVNFKEHIGYAVDKTTKKKTRTTWGKIHYAKDGVHIVPCLPRV